MYQVTRVTRWTYKSGICLDKRPDLPAAVQWPRNACQLQELRGGAGFGLVPDLKADVPAAAWYSFYLIHKNVALCANFL